MDTLDVGPDRLLGTLAEMVGIDSPTGLESEGSSIEGPQ